MSGKHFRIAALAAAAACALASGARAADNTATTSVGIDASILGPISIFAGTDLNFGTIFGVSNAAGTVVISPENARSGSASVLNSSSHSQASFTVDGIDGKLFDVSYAPSGLPAGYSVDTFLTTGCGLTDSSTLTGLTTSSSTCTLNVGATLHVPASASAGAVAGTLTTTVTYE